MMRPGERARLRRRATPGLSRSISVLRPWRPLNGRGFLPPVLDVEDSPNDNSYPYLMGKATLSQWIRDWCAEVKQYTGSQPMLYVTRSYARNYLDADLNQFIYWVPTNAGSPDSDPGSLGIWTSWMIQQYLFGDSGGTCPGVTGGVDLDSFNGDLNGLFSLAQSTHPNVTLTTKQVSPASVTVNQSFSVNTTLLVDTATADHAGISISFPSLTIPGKSGNSYSSSQGTVSTSFASSGAMQSYLDGSVDPMLCNGTCNNKNHLLAEADWSSVGAGSAKTFNLTVTPKQSGSFLVRIRAWVTTGGYANVWRDPASGGSVDQQNFSVYEYTVNVSSASTACSYSISPTSTTGSSSGGTGCFSLSFAS